MLTAVRWLRWSEWRCGSLVGVKAVADVCVCFQAHEDPMYDLIRENKRNEKETRYIRDLVTSHTHTVHGCSLTLNCLPRSELNKSFIATQCFDCLRNN